MSNTIKLLTATTKVVEYEDVTRFACISHKGKVFTLTYSLDVAFEYCEKNLVDGWKIINRYDGKVYTKEDL